MTKKMIVFKIKNGKFFINKKEVTKEEYFRTLKDSSCGFLNTLFSKNIK